LIHYGNDFRSNHDLSSYRNIYKKRNAPRILQEVDGDFTVQVKVSGAFVPADVTGSFAAAVGVADMDRILQVEFFNWFREIIGTGIQVVALPGLAGPALTSPVMGDTAEAVGSQKTSGPQRHRHLMANRD
jgi:hypothetical protein